MILISLLSSFLNSNNNNLLKSLIRRIPNSIVYFRAYKKWGINTQSLLLPDKDHSHMELKNNSFGNVSYQRVASVTSYSSAHDIIVQRLVSNTFASHY